MTIGQSPGYQDVLSMGIGALLILEAPLGHFAVHPVRYLNDGRKGCVSHWNITAVFFMLTKSHITISTYEIVTVDFLRLLVGTQSAARRPPQ